MTVPDRSPARRGRLVAAVSALVLAAVFAVMLAGPVPSSEAIIDPASVVAGPSPGIVGVGNVAMAPDGSGGVVWLQVAGGSTHVYVSQYRAGGWTPPIQVDTGLGGPASFPVIAAADDGELLVAWVTPYLSLSVINGAAQTEYELMSAVLPAGATAFEPAVPVDPHNVAQGAGVYPQLAMSPRGVAYIAYKVVTDPLNPKLPPQQGALTPLRPGDEMIDVRVARFNGLFWSSLGAVNAFPGEVTMRAPSATNAPAIAVSRSGQGLVVWQEPTIDGVARIWARRLFGTVPGPPLEVSPQMIGGAPVTADADAPAVSIGTADNVEVAFRLQGGAGSPLHQPTEFLNALAGAQDSVGGASFGPAVQLMSAGAIGVPSIAADDFSHFQAAFTAGGQTELAAGTSLSPRTLLAMGPAGADPALVALDPSGGGALAWPGINSAGQPVADVRQSLPDGGLQTASLSAPLTGPISNLTMGSSGSGSALIAFEQGASTTTQVVVSTIQAPASPFQITSPLGWVTPRRADVHWIPARTGLGPITYAVVLDGETIASGLKGTDFALPRRALGSGVYHVQIVATDGVHEQTMTSVSTLRIDATPPEVIARALPGARARVRIIDRYAGVRTGGTVISFGDGTRPVVNRVKATHAYARPGLYRITVRCASQAGNRAVDHIVVRVR